MIVKGDKTSIIPACTGTAPFKMAILVDMPNYKLTNVHLPPMDFHNPIELFEEFIKQSQGTNSEDLPNQNNHLYHSAVKDRLIKLLNGVKGESIVLKNGLFNN